MHAAEAFDLISGHHYKVELSDEKRKCQCVDHRCRKHDCKHIRLVLKSLGIEDSPLDWHSAVDKQVMQHSVTAASSEPEGVQPRIAERQPPSADALMAAKFL